MSKLMGKKIFTILQSKFCLSCRAVAAYLKVVRRRKSSSGIGTRGGGGEQERGIILLLLVASSAKKLNFERFYVRF